MKQTWITPEGPTYDLFEDALSQYHLMIAGASGSGKSVLLNGIIATLLHRLPLDVSGGAKMILIDKKGREFVAYRDLPHTILYATSDDETIAALNYAANEIQHRFDCMGKREKKYSGCDLYVIIDEFADLMTTQSRVVKPVLQRICQLGRAARVHVLLATQSPLREIISSTIKVNFDAVFGLHCNRPQDSRNIIGQSFLCDLPRYGQGFYSTPEHKQLYYIPYITDDEIYQICDYWISQKPKRRGLFRKSA